MHRAKGLDDLLLIGGQPRLRRFHHVPAEVRRHRPIHALPAPGRVAGGGTLATVRSHVAQAIDAFVGTDSRGRALLIAAAPGAGKSTATASAIRKHQAEARIVVGTRALARELADAHRYHLIVGRNHSNCERFDVVKALGEAAHRVEALACGTPASPRCPFLSQCRYFAQFAHSGPRVGASEQLFNRAFLQGGDLVVVDDADLPRSLIERWTVTGAVLERAAGQLAARGEPSALAILPIIQHAMVDAPPDLVTGAHGWDRLAASAARYGQDLAALVSALPERNIMPEPGEDDDGCVSVASVERVPPATLGLLFATLRRELAAFETGEDFNSLLALGRFGIAVARLREHAVDRQGRVIVEGSGLLVLDATPLHSLVDHLTARHERLPDVDGEIALPPNVTVVQYASSTNSHSVLPQEGRVARVVAEVQEERRRLPASDPTHEALITYKAAVPRFADAGFAPEQLRSFGAVRGTNAVEDVRRLHLVGRPMPPTPDTHYLAQVIHHGEPYVSPELVVVPREFGGQPCAVNVVDYADPRMAALLSAHRENEMIQVIHRARPFALDPQRRLGGDGPRESVTLVIHTSHPIPGLRIDRLVVTDQPGRDVNADRSQDAASRVNAALRRLKARGVPVTIEAVAREAGASWRTVQKRLGTSLHTPVETGTSASAETGAGTTLHTPVGVDPETVAGGQAVRTGAAAPGTTLHTPVIDPLNRVQSCPQIPQPPGPASRAHWVPCQGGCPALVPPGQKCFECAAAAVTLWKRSQKIKFNRSAVA